MIKRIKKAITYHGRTGHPVLHKTAAGRLYIMVRKAGGGVKRLYENSRYNTGNGSGKRGKGIMRRLRLR